MSASAKDAPVLVVGGGIGGLSAALALSRKGIPVQVLEQAPEFKEIGAGIQLGPNVFRMFEVLGLTEQMVHWGAFPAELEFRDSMTAETIVELKIDKRFHDKYRAPYGVIHRADMLNVIYEACKKSNLIKLATSQKVTTIDDDGSGVTVRTETGETYRGSALIGCDGLWSTVREKIVGDGKPVVSGHIAYRAVLPTDEWPKEYRLPKMIVWCGEKTHLVHYPLRRGELFNLVVVFHSDRYEEGWDTYGDPAELHERFKEKCEPVRTLLSKVNAWKMWVLCDRPPIKNWSKGRITLLGDAAHPMLQYLAQGANMAIEDAVCLADQIEAAGRDCEAAFKKYQELRYLRTARVQLMARVFGEIYHASGVNRELRNKLLTEWSAQGAIDMSWLYSHQPELPHIDHIPLPPPTRLAS
ncbi:MAG: 3-hydroxybenzoate 6-monooxygenase [Alphaproteobacteria bacterium]|nr:3-hydroxybenzoate 6-monooxygenase [Alphaproteobacteria bacterium]